MLKIAAGHADDTGSGDVDFSDGLGFDDVGVAVDTCQMPLEHGSVVERKCLQGFAGRGCRC